MIFLVIFFICLVVIICAIILYAIFHVSYDKNLFRPLVVDITRKRNIDYNKILYLFQEQYNKATIELLYKQRLQEKERLMNTRHKNFVTTLDCEWFTIQAVRFTKEGKICESSINKKYDELMQLFDTPIIDAKAERKKMTRALRVQIMQRDNYTCKICGKYMPDEVGLQIDHIIPVAKGGKTVPENLQVLCDKCNRKKSDK